MGRREERGRRGKGKIKSRHHIPPWNGGGGGKKGGKERRQEKIARTTSSVPSSHLSFPRGK